MLEAAVEASPWRPSKRRQSHQDRWEGSSQGARGARGLGGAPEVRDATGSADASPHHDHNPLAGASLNQLSDVLKDELLLLTAASTSKDTRDTSRGRYGRPTCNTDRKGACRELPGKSRQVVESEPSASPPHTTENDRAHPSCSPVTTFPITNEHWAQGSLNSEIKTYLGEEQLMEVGTVRMRKAASPTRTQASADRAGSTPGLQARAKSTLLWAAGSLCRAVHTSTPGM